MAAAAPDLVKAAAVRAARVPEDVLAAVPGGPREGGRKFFRRKKVCKFCVEKIDGINYKDVRLLSQFVAESGKIVPRRLTGVCTPHPAPPDRCDQAGTQHRAAALGGR